MSDAELLIVLCGARTSDTRYVFQYAAAKEKYKSRLLVT